MMSPRVATTWLQQLLTRDRSDFICNFTTLLVPLPRDPFKASPRHRYISSYYYVSINMYSINISV